MRIEIETKKLIFKEYELQFYNLISFETSFRSNLERLLTSQLLGIISNSLSRLPIEKKLWNKITSFFSTLLIIFEHFVFMFFWTFYFRDNRFTITVGQKADNKHFRHPYPYVSYFADKYLVRLYKN